jgi:hypothetical protein
MGDVETLIQVVGVSTIGQGNGLKQGGEHYFIKKKKGQKLFKFLVKTLVE